jgi:aldose 1-epimerase
MTVLFRPFKVFGQFKGEDVHEIVIGKAGQLQAHIITWGAVIRKLSWAMPDETRLPLTLGFESFEPYPMHSPYFGAVVGRYANRIAKGQYTYHGKTYSLDRNEKNQTTLHGGKNGYSQRLWHIADFAENSVTLTLNSPDGDEGFPGAAKINCTYSIVEGSRFEVAFSAEADKPTPMNLAQHAYFNLDGSRDISNHHLQIFADTYTPVDHNGIPTGSILPVGNTVFDFRDGRSLAKGGFPYDHNFVLSGKSNEPDKLRKAALLTSAKSGISMLIETTKPGLQFYNGHMIDVPVPGLNGEEYQACRGLCIETQYFPDSPNQPAFPSSILMPDHLYEHCTVFSFSSRISGKN